jgi:ATP-dependent Zn protease
MKMVKQNQIKLFLLGFLALVISLIFSFNLFATEQNPEIEFSNFIKTLDKNKVYSVSKATARYQSFFQGVKDQKLKLSGYQLWKNFYDEVFNEQTKILHSKNEQILNEGKNRSIETKNFFSSLKYNGYNISIEEGIYFLEPDYQYIVRNFSKFLPSWLSDFNKLIAQELKEGFMEYEKLVISKDKLSKRIVLWENYLKKYPGTENESQIQEKIKIYNKVLKENLKNGKK